MGTIAVRSGIAGARVGVLAIQVTHMQEDCMEEQRCSTKRKRTEGNHMTLQAMLRAKRYLPELNSDFPVEVGSHCGCWILTIFLNARYSQCL